MSISIGVKWGKEKYDLQINLNDSPLVLKQQLSEKTGVPVSGQKLMAKGKNIKDDSTWNSLNMKEGDVLMMVGIAEKDIPTKPSEKTIFLEDLTADQANAMQQVKTPSGLKNLGNTCYLNATLQSLRSIPELSQSLSLFKSSGDPSSSFIGSLNNVFNGLKKNQGNTFVPLEFVQTLRRIFPQFDQKGNDGYYMQQDAEECLSSILGALSQKVPKLAPPEELQQITNVTPDNSIVNQLFAFQTESRFENLETKDESPFTKTETVLKLSCHISSEVNHLMEGLKRSLEEEIEKNSTVLNRTARYRKTTRIAKLPAYTIIQFVRFFWKNDKQLKAKIVRPVEFPFTLDLFDLCTEDLKKELVPSRKQLQQVEEEKKEKKLKTGKEEQSQSIPDINTDLTHIPRTGIYELFAIVSHKGRTADSGHYVGWVKESENKWLKYDDDIVDYVNDDEIKKLSGKGGSDSHIAFIGLFKTKTS